MLDTPHILLVEDNEDDITLTLRAFRHSGHSLAVAVARDGAEALDYLFCRGKHEGRHLGLPLVVLMDINMPRMNGFEALRAIRRDERTEYLPVVMLTTSNHSDDVEQAYACGANSYIRKPVGFKEFDEVVQDLGIYWMQLNLARHAVQRSTGLRGQEPVRT